MCCVMSERSPIFIENTDLQIVQNIFLTSLASFKKGNSNFKCGVKTHRLIGNLSTNYCSIFNFKLNHYITTTTLRNPSCS